MSPGSAAGATGTTARATAAAVVTAQSVRASLDTLCDPEAREWGRAPEASVGLEPTPVDRQPSAYVQAAWRGRPRGDIREARVRALVTASALALRLDWAAPRPVRRIDDWNVYADACAVLFPADGRNAELATMGSARKPVEGWHWRAGTEDAFCITARGLGTVQRADEHAVRARAVWEDGRWRVVLARPLSAAGVQFGDSVPLGVAIWCGAAKERAGLKSHSPVWNELRLTGGEA